MLFVYPRVGINRDTRRGGRRDWAAALTGFVAVIVAGMNGPAGAGAGRTADHITVLFSQKIIEVRESNSIYRSVSRRIIKALSNQEFISALNTGVRQDQ